MLRIQANSRRLCDHLPRRTFLRLGGLGSLGLALPSLLRGATERVEGTGFGRAKRCLMLFLTGGPPQMDTWDPKPGAPVDVRGELRPISTVVPGIQFSELFPQT